MKGGTTSERPPNEDIEAAVIAAMLHGGDGFVDLAISKLRPIDFYHPLYRAAFEIAIDLRLEHELPFSILTIPKYAKQYKGKQIMVSDLVDLDEAMPSAMYANPETAEPYFRILHEAGNARLKSEAVQAYSQGKMDADTLSARLLEIEEAGKHDRPLYRSMREEIEEFRGMIEQGKAGPVLTLGLGDLDQLVRVYEGNVICIAGDTSMGKSTIALQIVQHVAREMPVLFASIEMVARELIMRLMAIKTGTLPEVICDPTKTHPALRERIYGTFDWLSNLPIEIMDVTRCDAINIMRAAESVHRKHGKLGLIVIDYIQRMPWPRGVRSEFEAASKNSTEIKDIAMETKVPTIVVSQINRAGPSENRLPQLHDLRNSGRIGEDADTVIMVGVIKKNKDQDPREIHERLLLCRKQRNGPTGYVHATFDPIYVRYDNIRFPAGGA